MPARSIIDCLTPVCSGVSFDSEPERRLVGVDCRLPVAGVMCEVKCLIGPRESKSLRAGAHRIEILTSGGPHYRRFRRPGLARADELIHRLIPLRPNTTSLVTLGLRAASRPRAATQREESSYSLAVADLSPLPCNSPSPRVEAPLRE
jgi:hypothetical protein